VTDLETSVAPFDVCGPLPAGVTVLEASAGTGKTYTIAALATRYVAEGTPLDRLLLVTFTRMATGELRERVWERLASAEEGLGRALAGAPPAGDALVALLASGDREDVVVRHRRLQRALAGFDGATIATTHGFCQEVLGGMGIDGDVEPDAAFVEDVRDLLSEVVDDLYVRRFHSRDTPDFGRREAMRIAEVAVANPAAPLEPQHAPEDTVEAMRVRLAGRAREELDRRKLAMGVMTYDDLLTRLDEALGSDAAAQRLRERYSVVLVDEFQDTDPVQWRIMRRAFGAGDVTLVLIGDPKQAIYAFRGADVYAYLDAAREAGTRATLDVNWRSDQGLLDAYDALFGGDAGTRLGHEGIVYRRVRAAPANAAPRLTGAPQAAPLRIRVVHREDPGLKRTRGGSVTNASAREHIATDLAADLAGLLESGARIEVRDDAGAVRERPQVRPGHVAVLVRTHRNAALVRDALEEAGIPAVINGAGSVFGTTPARDWLRLLEALERPSHAPRARAAALTPFLGWTAQELASADDDALEELHRRLHAWARLLRTRGVAALAETVTLVEGLPERLLRTQDGERRLTDLRHVAQLLHEAATAEHAGVTALTGWLRRQIADAGDDTGDEERSRRLESDAEAVQVLTIHRSKGLEFPIVLFPYLWEPGYIPRDPQPIFFHDPARGDERIVDVGMGGVDFAEHRRQHEAEQRGEDLRLAYVALTRAQHQAVVWWAGSWDSRNSALGRLLFSRREDGTVPPSGGSTPSDAAAIARFEQLAAQAPGRISVEHAWPAQHPPWSDARTSAAELVAARFGRRLDWGWRRTSYSDITAGAHDARVASEPEEHLVTDEDDGGGPPPVVEDGGDALGLAQVPSLLADMPSGVHVGTFVHGVMEATDFAAADLDAELARRIEEVQARRAVEIGERAMVGAGLGAVVATPLGPLLDGARLRDVARADRLDELDFELPLAGGDAPKGSVELASIGAVLRDDPALAGYAERLEDPALRSRFRGYLTGSVDLVVRRGDRFAVVDYKTNWLGAPGEPLTAWDYRPAVLAAEMRRSHYVLQALLYTVVLHRFLRWRLPGYDPERNLAGVLYLFLRGMSGPDTPVVGDTPCGVFSWRPRPGLVTRLSDVLDGGAPRPAPAAAPQMETLPGMELL
jgi:exodeoxyribonuclease V beta subunit